MKEGNNGGYANNWLADVKTNEIASLELGLKNVNLRRSKNGYFVGSNFPVDEKLGKEETRFPPLLPHRCGPVDGQRRRKDKLSTN